MFDTTFAGSKASSCKEALKISGPTIIGSITNEETIPVIGAYAEIKIPGANPVNVISDEKGCFHTSLASARLDAPISMSIKRKADSAVLARIVERCQFDTRNICEIEPIKLVSPNTVYLLPFDGEDSNVVFLSKQFRSALAKRFVMNLQELEGEKEIRLLKAKQDVYKFRKLKPPSLKLYKGRNAQQFEISDFEKLDKLGEDLNALSLITGSSFKEEESHMLDLSSFYLVPDQTTWELEDRLDEKKLKNMIALSRKLNPQWTYYTMMALAKREISEANASPNKKQELKRIKAYLQAQRNQFDSRSKLNQNELLDMLCEIRQELGEQCGQLYLTMDK
ncbi:MAG: hypothetical protein R3240_02695 [Gammaproteobacteria bacterium]|nr:hypothetical protein [Gammaproteobacteria bacterium]